MDANLQGTFADVRFERPSAKGSGNRMLETIVVLLVLLWLVGMVSSYTLGGLIHILLVIALVVVVLRIIQGRRPV